MQRKGLTVAVLAGALVTLTAAQDGRKAQRLANPFRPLTEADLRSGAQGGGCSCVFTAEQGRRQADLLMLYDGALTTRTSAGRRTCRVSDAQVAAIDAGRGSVTCDDRRISIALSNRQRGATDDTGSDARMTIYEGGRSAVLRGGWGCAC